MNAGAWQKSLTAFVTVVTDSAGVVGALVVGHSVRRTHRNGHSLVVLVSAIISDVDRYACSFANCRGAEHKHKTL